MRCLELAVRARDNAFLLRRVWFCCGERTHAVIESDISPCGRRFEVGGDTGDVPIECDDAVDIGLFVACNEPATLGDSREGVIRPDAGRMLLDEIHGVL